MNPLFIDLESLPSSNPEVIAKIKEGIKAPANYKDPGVIAKYIEEKTAESVAKTGLDGAYGSIACIGWKHGDDCKIYTTTPAMTEKEVIKDFYKAVEDSTYKTDSFCGHNLVNFDLPFLKHRSMVLGIKPPQIIMDAFNAKPWESTVIDTMYMWTGSTNKYISLDVLCWIFGIEGKGGFDGSMVADTWGSDPQKVLDYCAGDVQRTYEVYKRMKFEDKVF